MRPSIVSVLVAVIAVAVVAVVAPTAALAATDHLGTNRLVFAPVGSSTSRASGTGVVDYGGGVEPRSKWSSSFRFVGLRTYTDYVVVVQGRSGVDGSPEAVAFTELCSFRSDGEGAGGCWRYFRGLVRLDVVQLRLAGASVPTVVLQATSDELRSGTITRAPNRYTAASSVPTGRRNRG